MRKCYGAALLALILAELLFSLLSSHYVVDLSRSIEAPAIDAEGRLAFGEKMNFWSSDMYALELIPKVSDKLASRMLEKSSEIYVRSDVLLPDDKYQALQVVKGIGTKTSKRLGCYLTLKLPRQSPGATQ